jgi:hypothetical protein
MKEFFAAFGFRPLATLVLPGLIALTPVAVAIIWSLAPMRLFVQANQGVTIGTIIALGIFCGLVLEDIGARIEDWLFRRRFRDDKEARDKDWYDYLRLASNVEPVGLRYISTLVLRLKFELGSCSATPFAMLGVWFWPITWFWRALASGIILALGVYLFIEADASVGTLADVRREMLKGAKSLWS